MRPIHHSLSVSRCVSMEWIKPSETSLPSAEACVPGAFVRLRETLVRPRVIAAFEMLEGKRDENPRRKHGNIPL